MTDTIPMTPEEVADHLDHAADIILDKGLARRAWTSNGAVCSNEAIAQALGNYTTNRSSSAINTMCLPTVKALALYLAGRYIDQATLAQLGFANLASAVANPAHLIIAINDGTDADMGEGMRSCAKYLREMAGREAKA